VASLLECKVHELGEHLTEARAQMLALRLNVSSATAESA
jgi:hypothetical protein